MKKRIIKELSRLEQENNIKIIYACESGSRAWGFPSINSDYDVRFIYVHPKDWYLTITEKKDVIQLPVDEKLDINGWDIRKALKLLKKSNPTLHEWLSSPIVYWEKSSAVKPFATLSKKAFLPESSCWHYLSMAENSMAKSGDNNKVRIKTYLYALRTVLCCKWIIEKMESPPMRIQELLSVFLPGSNLRKYIDRLISEKSKGSETAVIKRSKSLEDYLDAQLQDMRNHIPKNPRKLQVSVFDGVFREILNVFGE